MATLLAMPTAEHLSLVDAKNHLSEVVDRVEREHGRVVITKHGRPAAVLVSLDDLEGLEETLAVLSEPGARADIVASRVAFEQNEGVRLTREQIVARRAVD